MVAGSGVPGSRVLGFGGLQAEEFLGNLLLSCRATPCTWSDCTTAFGVRISVFLGMLVNVYTGVSANCEHDKPKLVVILFILDILHEPKYFPIHKSLCFTFLLGCCLGTYIIPTL